MKVKITKQNTTFQPVQVIITLETPDEFKALYEVANDSSLVAAKVSERSGLPEASIEELLLRVWEHLVKICSDGIIK